MATLDQLVEDNIVPDESKELAIQEVSDAIDDKETPHSQISSYHGLDRVNEYPSVEHLKDLLVKYNLKQFASAELAAEGTIDQVYIHTFDDLFNHKLSELHPINSFSKMPSKVNYTSISQFVREDMDSDKEKMKIEIKDSLAEFLKIVYNLKTGHSDLIDEIESQIDSIQSLIQMNPISESANRILASDDKILDSATVPLKEILTAADYSDINSSLSDDLLLFIIQVVNSIPPNSSFASLNDSINSVRDSLSLSTLETFYLSNNLFASLSVLDSYIDRAKEVLEQNIESTNNEEFQLLQAALPEANEVIKNLRYTNGVFTSITTFNVAFISVYKQIQSLL
jgi:hypothetical protein